MDSSMKMAWFWMTADGDLARVPKSSSCLSKDLLHVGSATWTVLLARAASSHAQRQRRLAVPSRA